jgi:hypothetical protein
MTFKEFRIFPTFWATGGQLMTLERRSAYRNHAPGPNEKRGVENSLDDRGGSLRPCATER